MKKNSAQVWDAVWSDPGLQTNDRLILMAEAATIRWQRIRTILQRNTGGLKGLKVVEVGAGIGTYAALLAQRGAQVSVLDYSDKALERAEQFFRNNNLKANFIKADALNPPAHLLRKYDISISVGLTEHFKGKDRLAINKFHLDVLKKGGVAIIVVPNSFNPPYRIFKFISEITGTWKFGEEYPYTRAELLKLPQQLNSQFIALFGDDLYSSLKFLLPANFLRRFFRVGSPSTEKEIRIERGTPLDNYIGYSLVLMMKKR